MDIDSLYFALGAHPPEEVVNSKLRTDLESPPKIFGLG